MTDYKMSLRAKLYYILHGWIKGTRCMCMQLTIRVISILECVNNNEDIKLQDTGNLRFAHCSASVLSCYQWSPKICPPGLSMAIFSMDGPLGPFMATIGGLQPSMVLLVVSLLPQVVPHATAIQVILGDCREGTK